MDEFDIGNWVSTLRRDLDTQRQRQELEKQAHMEQLINAAKSQAQQNVAPIPGVEELIAQATAQRRQGVPMQGGRTVLGEGGFGPNVGEPVPGAQVPVPAPPMADEGAAIAGLLSRGFQQMGGDSVGPPGARGPGAAGIGAGGNFYELPEAMRHRTPQQFSPEQIASAKVRSDARAAELQSRQAGVDNIGEARGMARQGRMGVSPLAQMMARTDDPGQAGEFARGAVSPQSAAIMAQRQGAAGQLQLDRDKLESPQAMLAAIGAARGASEQPMPGLDKIIQQIVAKALTPLTGGAALGTVPTPPVPGFATSAPTDATSVIDKAIAASPTSIEEVLDAIPPELVSTPEAQQYLRDKLMEVVGFAEVNRLMSDDGLAPIIPLGESLMSPFTGEQPGTVDPNQALNERRAKIGAGRAAGASRSPVDVYGTVRGLPPPVMFHP